MEMADEILRNLGIDILDLIEPGELDGASSGKHR